MVGVYYWMTVAGIVCSLLYGSCLANQHSATACYFAIPKTEDLSCENDEVIELGQVWVARNGHSCELTLASDPYCAFHQVETTHPYYEYLQSDCTGKPACVLDSRYLWSTARFDISCSSGIRSIVKVDYICSLGENTEAPTTRQIITTSETGSAPSSSKIVTHSAPAVVSSTNDYSNRPTDGELTGTTGRDELLVVKIAAPILGALTVAALIVLVICLKRKRFHAAPKENKCLNTAHPNPTDTYETLTQGEGDATYYTQLKLDNTADREPPLYVNLQDGAEDNSDN